MQTLSCYSWSVMDRLGQTSWKRCWALTSGMEWCLRGALQQEMAQNTRSLMQVCSAVSAQCQAPRAQKAAFKLRPAIMSYIISVSEAQILPMYKWCPKDFHPKVRALVAWLHCWKVMHLKILTHMYVRVKAVSRQLAWGQRGHCDIILSDVQHEDASSKVVMPLLILIGQYGCHAQSKCSMQPIPSPLRHVMLLCWL